MLVIEYLKEHCIDKLSKDFGIVVKEYDNLLVLNYNQIESPKTHPIVGECRGLILDKQYNIVSRSFDRFFNLGEAPDTQKHLDFKKAVCFEKIDGSLIKIYNHKGFWNISTRGTAFAESDVDGFGITFKDLVLKALDCTFDEFQDRCNMFLDQQWTYICEITSKENRVVKVYNGYTLYFLASRHNYSGEFGDTYESEAMCKVGAVMPSVYKFATMDECIESARTLKNLDEGYVVYQDGIPVCKVKSPAYLAVHAIRGEGLTPKRIKQLVLTQEQDEYLVYFPEDTRFFTKYINGFSALLTEIEETYHKYKLIEDQKDFAIAVGKFAYSGCLFQARVKKISPTKVFHSMRESYKMQVLDKFVEV